MLIRFSDDYINEVNAAYDLVGRIQAFLCEKEKFMGNSQYLDKLYAWSMLLSGIIDHLEHDDNSDPKANEALLLCLRKLLAKNICGPRKPNLIDVRNYHQTEPVGVTNPAGGIPVIQSTSNMLSGNNVLPSTGQIQP